MSHTVLVVDDDEQFRTLAVRILQSWGHEIVGETATVVETRAAAAELRPDIVLLDIGLPDGEGFELTRELLGLPVPPGVVLISSDADVGNHSAAERAGALGFVPKDEVAGARMRSLLDGTRAARQAPAPPRDVTAPVRVVLGEDDVLLRSGIAKLIGEAGIEVVAQAGDAEDLVRKVLAHRPDVAIIDVQMPPRREDDGLVAALDLRQRLPDMGVLILSAHVEASLAERLIGERADGFGYLLKERVSDVPSFVDAITRVARGGSALDPIIVSRIFKRRAADDPLAELTPRERSVLELMAEGKSNGGIAAGLCISGAAVEKHVTAIFRKLDISPAAYEHRRVHAVLAYLRSAQRSP
jgi:DNA-binding NarL/FixJ family response regulator